MGLGEDQLSLEMDMETEGLGSHPRSVLSLQPRSCWY